MEVTEYGAPRYEPAGAYQKDLLLERIARILNEERDIEATYRNGGIDVLQGGERIGYVYHRIKTQRDFDTLRQDMKQALAEVED